MTRRIVLAILALICVLLATVAVPLGLITAAHDRQDYRDQAAATARSLAGVAEEKLADHERGAALELEVHGSLRRRVVRERRGATATVPQRFAAPQMRGMPAISLPLLQSTSGLPIGVQIVGPRLGDARLLRTARWLAAW